MSLNGVVKVRPAPARRVEFARWAVAASRRIRTRSEVEFGVPADLFGAVPEDLLVGARVDGQPYVPVGGPADSAPPGPPPAWGDSGGESPGDADDGGDDGDDGGNGENESAAGVDPPPAPHACDIDGCDRTFTSQRGLSKHRTSVHSGGA